MANKPTRVAINGFGRIGRGFFRAAHGREELEIAAVNDLTPVESLAYLLKYDTVYRKAPFTVNSEQQTESGKGALIVDGKKITVCTEKEPSALPWKAMEIDVVVESTGLFTDAEKAKGHIAAGAKRVVISAPVKGEKGGEGGERAETILLGANEEKFGTCDVTSNASCTTNAASPLIGILDEAIGIERAVLSTVHAYTASQSLVDGGKAKDLREMRAAAQNIVPSSTGAAKATALAYPQLKGKFDGISLRVPVSAGSIVDVTFVAKRPTSAEEVNAALKKASGSERWKKVFVISEDPLVSSDIVGSTYGAIADLAMTRVVDGMLVKVLAWYDNEAGYSHTLVEHVIEVGKRLR